MGMWSRCWLGLWTWVFSLFTVVVSVVWLKGHAGLNQQRVQIYFWHQMSMSSISCNLNKNIAWISLLRPVYERKRTLQYGAGGKLGHVGSYEERWVPVETVGAAFRALPFHLLFKTSSWPLPTLPRQPEPQGTPVTLQALSQCCQSNE